MSIERECITKAIRKVHELPYAQPFSTPAVPLRVRSGVRPEAALLPPQKRRGQILSYFANCRKRIISRQL
jgi:hypothetical protein